MAELPEPPVGSVVAAGRTVFLREEDDGNGAAWRKVGHLVTYGWADVLAAGDAQVIRSGFGDLPDDAIEPLIAARVRAEALERRANAPAAASSETDVMRGRLRSRAASSGIVGEGPEMVDAFERAIRAEAAAGERRRIAAAIEDEARSDKHRTAYECRRGLFKAAEIAREVAAGSGPVAGQGEQLLADVDTLRDIAPGDSVVGDTLCEIADRVERAAGSVPVATQPRPEIVVLCGSTRFKDAFREAAKANALAGRIVLTVSDLDPRPEMRHVNVPIDAETKARLDELHKRKIDLADRVLVLNVGGYIGESTRSEIQYATAHRKPISYLEPTCTCPWTDPSTWTYYCGATEPGSEREFDPECPQHGQSAGPVATPRSSGQEAGHG